MKMSESDVRMLRQLKKDAPGTWRCCSFYYEIAAKYGFAVDNGERRGIMFPDDDRNDFIDKALSDAATDLPL